MVPAFYLGLYLNTCELTEFRSTREMLALPLRLSTVGCLRLHRALRIATLQSEELTEATSGAQSPPVAPCRFSARPLSEEATVSLDHTNLISL